MVVNDDNTIIVGLAINRFCGSGIVLNASSATIRTNFLGTDPSGTIDRGNGAEGLRIVNGSNNTIGGAGNMRNVMSGNEGNGIWINGGSNNNIRHNFIGTNVDGSADLGNTQSGVKISNGTGNNVGGSGPDDGNVISGNDQHGVHITGGSGNFVVGNRIGVTSTETEINPLANSKDGVRIEGGSKNNRVEGKNVIAGNGENGVRITGGGTDDNIVDGNYIGTDANDVPILANGQNGVKIDAGAKANRVINGNVISGNTENGVYISGANENVVTGNKIGVNGAATAKLANSKNGVLIDGGAQKNEVRGGNIISGNDRNGIHITGNGTNENYIEGNKIGTNNNDAANLGNTEDGVRIDGGAQKNEVRNGNLISGNLHSGVVISGANENIVKGNYIGTNKNGDAELPNQWEGVRVMGGASSNKIGVANDGNLISGNVGSGIWITGSGTNSNKIQGNLIGTNKNGNDDIPNRDGGIVITTGPTSNRIGVEANAAERNIISGNLKNGIWIAGANGNIITGNKIGVQIDGTSPLGNADHGIKIEANSTQIGTDANGANDALEGNTIAHNGGDGVYIESGTGNSIRRNSIFGNGGLGIDLGPNGVTLNDRKDGDGGANNLQNFPIISSVAVAGVTTKIGLAIDSVPAKTYTIEVFSNAVPDASGHGEGKTYLGSMDLVTAADGFKSDFYFFPGVLPEGTILTATATRTDTNDTSEFSPNRVQSAAGVTFRKHDNAGYDSATEALNVSNYVTNDGTILAPGATTWATVNVDPDNFRLQVDDALRHAAGAASVTVDLEVFHEGTGKAYVITLDDKEAGAGADGYRSAFIRLVSDATDDAIDGDQTILVALGDNVRATYTDTVGGKHVTDLMVGRPSAENDNGANQLRHDIRVVTLNIHVFQNAAGNGPAVTQAAIDADIAHANERLAQSTIRVHVGNINFGPGGNGIVEAAFNDGFTTSPGLVAMATVTADETAARGHVDADVNTLDVLYVHTQNNGGGWASSYPDARNTTGDNKYENFLVVASKASNNAMEPFVLPHEILHILLDAPHRPGEPATALFDVNVGQGNVVGASKRIGPYPDAATAGVGNGDTGTARGNTEALPLMAPVGTLESQSVIENELTLGRLAPIIDQAISHWRDAGIGQESLDALAEVEFFVDALPEGILGETVSSTNIYIDDDASGAGWYINANPSFPNGTFKGVDLLTVVIHELGHTLGLEHVDGLSHPHHVMGDTLETGVRKVPFASGASSELIPARPSLEPSSSDGWGGYGMALSLELDTSVVALDLIRHSPDLTQPNIPYPGNIHADLDPESERPVALPSDVLRVFASMSSARGDLFRVLLGCTELSLGHDLAKNHRVEDREPTLEDILVGSWGEDVLVRLARRSVKR